MKIKKRSVTILDKAKKRAAPIEVQEVKADSSEDMTQVAMTRTIEAPIVGKYNVREELGKKKLKQGKSYYLPPNVARHLKDIKAAVIVGDTSIEDDDDDEAEELAED